MTSETGGEDGQIGTMAGLPPARQWKSTNKLYEIQQNEYAHPRYFLSYFLFINIIRVIPFY
jgi:hypothetical protein